MILSCAAFSAFAINISRVEPAFWWTGMKNAELQVMIYGKDIARSSVQFEYPGVRLKELVRLENPNYLFLYLDIAGDTAPGVVHFTFVDGKKKVVRPFELKERIDASGAQGFDTSDVLYLIMPDRFANGDPANDVWDDMPVERDDPVGRHGGDFAGIRKHAEYICDLGVTAVWLNPVLENRNPRGSYHGYATTDFYKVDPRFGSNEDYCRLIDELHGKGLKVIMDMIYNHCGSHHWWMGDFPSSDWLNHQEGFVPTSHDLYTVMDPHAPESEVSRMTDGWFVPDMPDLNQRNPHLATYLIQNSIWWIEYARIDGIRHDTHPYADFDFLAKWCKAVDDEYPDFNIVGESWYVNSAPLAWWQRNSVVSERQTNLKTTMDFSLMSACEKAFGYHSAGHNPLRAIYEAIAQDFIYHDWKKLLIFLDNHDTSRFFKEGETDLKRYKQALAFLLTTRGIPQLYYGTEILMHGEKKDGDGNLRKDFPGGWDGDTTSRFTMEGRSELQNEAWDYMRKLLRWRKTSRAVTDGKLMHYAPDYQSECYAYARVTADETILVILNGSGREQTLPVKRFREAIKNYTLGKDVITGDEIDLRKDITISAKGVRVLKMENEE
jgi:glycosidase